MNEVIGIDVGGANLKYATLGGAAHWRGFAMWRFPERLSETLLEDLKRHRLGRSSTLAVTMTGELADCFLDRAEGVRHIAEQVAAAAGRLGVGRALFYGVDGRFYTAAEAIECPDTVAAANWHALASYVGREVASDALLADVGSTTTDLIPIAGGEVATEAKTDHDRLKEGSLVYVGCRRTPVCCLVERLRFRGQDVPVMNESFATIDDARILVGSEPEDPEDCDSADGKPRSRRFAAGRLARMVGLDHRSVDIEEARELASQVMAAARRPIERALSRWQPSLQPAGKARLVLSGHGGDLVLSGCGEGLVDGPSGGNVVELSRQLGAELCRCAPSYAVARLLHPTLP